MISHQAEYNNSMVWHSAFQFAKNIFTPENQLESIRRNRFD